MADLEEFFKEQIKPYEERIKKHKGGERFRKTIKQGKRQKRRRRLFK